ncbi:MAG: ABC transporter ATP-binding protein/permease [Oscillospiraceae bacterium]|nr:ABC transporter ATP-binding protein/permease [Oscillospiraceae bacterium]
MKKNPKEKHGNSQMLNRFLQGSRGLFLLSMLASALAALADMLAPQIVRITVDNVIGGETAGLPGFVLRLAERIGGFAWLRAHLGVMALLLLAVALLKAAAQYAYEVSRTKASETLVKTMRDQLFSHIERLPYAWHMQNHTGDIIQRCTSDIDTLKNFLAEQMTNIIRVLILLALSLAFMMSMHPGLTLIAMLPVPVIILYSFYFHRRIGEAFLDCDENEGLLSTLAQENLSGVRVVRAFGRERAELDRFQRQNARYTDMWMKLARPLATFWSVGDVLSGLQILLTVVFGARLCIRDEMGAGAYIAFLSYCAMMTWPVRMLGRMISEMSKAGVSMDRISQIMTAEEEREEGRCLTPSVRGEIRFEHVSFAYESGGEVLHDLDFSVPAGSTLGILGGTGSGKSTLVMLLDKLYTLSPEQGRILMDGTDIRDISTGHLRRSIGMVLQEPFLFSRSIAENIGIQDERLTMAQIRGAARAASLDETVMGFARGYRTFVGERGVTLSGGQKQRAAIARTLTRNTPILIFDDSLSAVDTETDAKIRASLESRFGSATIILISHRITTLSKADQILVLDHGSIAERGTHEQLKDAGGIYQQICRIQSGEAAG